MRGFLTLFSLFALASPSAFASPIEQRTDKCVDEFCGGKSFIEAPNLIDPTVDTPTRSIKARDVDEMTNADRFVRGLPPKKPKQFQASPVRRSQSSPAPLVNHRGIIRVNSGDTVLGYLAQDPNYWTPLLTSATTSATIVTFQSESTHVSGLVSDLTIENNVRGSGFPFLGPVVGRDSTSSNIAPGSFNYLYIGETSHTEPGSTPQSVPSFFSTSTGLDKQTESSVWEWTAATNALALQWVNTDSTEPTTEIWVQSNHLYAGGDRLAFQSRFPAPTTPVTLTFVPL